MSRAGAETKILTLPEEFTVIEAGRETLDSFILLLDQVGGWLWRKGVKQWAPGTFQKNRKKLTFYVDNGCLILAYQKDELAGGCILSAVNPGWPDAPAEAMYLSSLAVARFAAGKGLGRQIITTCTKAAGRRGKSLIRLDCWDGNSFLKSYYQQEGFKMLETIPEGDYEVRLFEKSVGDGRKS